MRLQTNSFPDHCYGGRPTVNSQNIDIRFRFNPPTSSLSPKSWSSQDSFDSQVCRPPKTREVPAQSEFYSMISATNQLEALVGITVNGVQIYSSSSAENVDPYFPKSWSGASKVQSETVDACIGHPQFDGIYHYHLLPPCVFGSSK